MLCRRPALHVGGVSLRCGDEHRFHHGGIRNEAPAWLEQRVPRAKQHGQQVFGEQEIASHDRDDDVDLFGDADILEAAMQALHRTCRPLAATTSEANAITSVGSTRYTLRAEARRDQPEDAGARPEIEDHLVWGPITERSAAAYTSLRTRSVPLPGAT